MSDWKVGKAIRAERTAMASYFAGHAKTSEGMAEGMKKGAELALMGAALAFTGAVGLACIGASGGLAAPAVAVGMQALIGATVGLMGSMAGLKKLESVESKRATALGAAVGRLKKGAMMDVVLLELERGDIAAPALGKSFVERLGFRRAAKAEREQMNSKVEPPRPLKMG